MASGVRTTRASVVVGRDEELELLRGAVRTARAGGTAGVVLAGEGGVGKTRLLAEAATFGRQTGAAVLSGRAPIVTPASFSVFTEALRSWLRGHERPGPLTPFDRGLRLALPEWTVPDEPADLDSAQLHLLALEGIVRLIAGISESASGVVVLLDDMHAADPASLEAMRHLMRADLSGVATIAALRSGESPLADDAVDALRRVGDAQIVQLEPLGVEGVADLIAALLDARPPDRLVDDIVQRTDGVPLLVEEVVLAHVRAGTLELREGATTWRDGDATVPRTIRELTDARLRSLAPRQRDVVVAGAVVGDFEPSLMVAVAQADDDLVSESLAEGVRAGLLETSGGAIAFRHRIIREAVLDATVPHLVDTMHRRAAAHLDVAGATTRDDAARLERRATHLEALAEIDKASASLSAAAAAHVDSHSLLVAEKDARRALALAESGATRLRAADTLANVLATQGRWTEALDLDTATAHEHGQSPARQERMAACAVEVGRPDLAESILLDAGENGDLTPAMRITAGRAALVRGDATTALEIARSVRAESSSEEHDLRFAALDLEGRAHDFLGDREDAKASWERQAREALAAGRTQAQLRAVVQLGKVELFAGEPPNRLYEAVDLAREAGALVELGWAQENLAVALAIRGDVAGASAVLDDAVPRCRALRLDQLAYLLAGQAISASYTTGEGVEERFAEAEAVLDTLDLRVHTASMRGDIALRERRYDDAVRWFDLCDEILRAMPGIVPSDAACWRVWALAAAGRSDAARAALAEAYEMPDLERWYGRPVVLAAAAAALDGDAEGVDRALEGQGGRMPLDAALMRLLAAELIDGPARVRWLRDAFDAYEAAGATLAADRVRQALREAGGPVPRRRRVQEEMPPDLLAAGVTAREAEVLRLLGKGLSNSDIGAQLFVSVRTVEAHVSSLLAKLHARNRAQLATVATRSFG